LPYVLVPYEVRQELYRVSPAMASIEPFLEGARGSVLVRSSWVFNPCGVPHPCWDFGGLFVMWAFRQAASDAGYHQSGREALRFYRSVADEISRACESGALRCGPPHNSIVPPWRPYYGLALARTLVLGTAIVLSMPVRAYVFDPEAPQAISEGNPAALDGFYELTGNRLFPPKESPATEASRLRPLDRTKLSMLRGIATLYRHVFPFFVLAGLLAFLVSLSVAAWRRRGSLPLLLATALLVSIALRLLALSYIEICMFPAFANWPAYITPLYPLLILFAGVSLGEAVHLGVRRSAPSYVPQEAAAGSAPPTQGAA
jgi:hypothetical protein